MSTFSLFPQDGTVLYPFFFQYKVQPSMLHKEWSAVSSAIASVMVFAECGSTGRCRSTRFINEKQWEVVEFLRAMPICPHQVNNFDATLGKVYRQAELFGISACFDKLGGHLHKKQ